MSVYHLLGAIGAGVAIVVLAKMVSKMHTELDEINEDLRYLEMKEAIPESSNRPGSYHNRIARFYESHNN